MKGEDRGGGKARQHGDGLATDDGEAERLSRLERDAMDENVAQFRDDAVGEIARTLRRAAGEYDHVASRERRAHATLERGLIVGECAEGNRRPTRRHQLVAG